MSKNPYRIISYKGFQDEIWNKSNEKIIDLIYGKRDKLNANKEESKLKQPPN